MTDDDSGTLGMFSHAGEGQDAALCPDLAKPLSVYHAVNWTLTLSITTVLLREVLRAQASEPPVRMLTLPPRTQTCWAYVLGAAARGKAGRCRPGVARGPVQRFSPATHAVMSSVSMMFCARSRSVEASSRTRGPPR